MAFRYLLDTNVLSDVVRHPHGTAVGNIARVGADTVCTSVIVAAELRFGAEKSGSERLQERVALILSAIDVLPLAPPVDLHYAQIRWQLERRGEPIGPNDLLIASQALALGLTVITANTREFSRVSGLGVENWLQH